MYVWLTSAFLPEFLSVSATSAVTFGAPKHRRIQTEWPCSAAADLRPNEPSFDVCVQSIQISTAAKIDAWLIVATIKRALYWLSNSTVKFGAVFRQVRFLKRFQSGSTRLAWYYFSSPAGCILFWRRCTNGLVTFSRAAPQMGIHPHLLKSLATSCE